MRKIKKSFFTLLEVLVSMGVFSLLMLALMQFFSAAQGVWERTGNKAELFDSAKVAMDILANDLTCAYYERDYDPNQFQFFNISSSDTSKIVFAAQKEGGSSAIYYKWDSASWKLYRYEKEEKDVFTSTSGSNPEVTWSGEGGSAIKTGWFTRSGNKNWIGAAGITSVTLGDSSCLAENLLDFSIKAYAKTDTTYSSPISTSLDHPLPDIIIISMIMLSNDAHEKLLNRLTNDAGIKAFFEGTADNSKFKYLKSDGKESSDEKSVKDILNAGGSIIGNDDTTQAILFNGCQRFTRAVSLVDRVN